MDSLTQYDEKDLIRLVAQGHKGAFTQLFNQYSVRLRPFVLGLTKSPVATEEIIQEIFMRIWFQRERLDVLSEPKTWIYNTTATVCYQFLKTMLTERKWKTTIGHESYFDNDDAVESIRMHKLAADIHNAIRRLSPQQKRVYKLSREKGLKVPEIAEELSLSPNSVRTLLNSSVEAIHEHLEHKGHSI